MDILARRRLWIDNRNYPGRRGLRPEFTAGVLEFIAKARTTDDFIWHGQIRCPCVRCKCVHIQDLPTVEIHLYEKGFMPDYYIWVNHGETRELQDRINDLEVIHGGRSSPAVEPDLNNYRMEDMVNDAFGLYQDNDPLQPGTSQPNIEEHRLSQQSEAGSSTPAPLTAEDEKRIWLEVTGGVKKGCAYGWGTMYASDTAQSSYLGSTIPSPSVSADPDEMARMKAEIAELKQQNEAIKQQNEAMQQQNKEHQTKMEKMVAKLLGKSEKGKKKKSSSKSKKKKKRRQRSSSESNDESVAESSSG